MQRIFTQIFGAFILGVIILLLATVSTANAIDTFYPDTWNKSGSYDVSVSYTTSFDLDTVVDYKVYPNPFNDYITVENATELSRIIIINMAGRKVKDIIDPQTTNIQTGDLDRGVYLISFYINGKVVQSKRIVKKR